MYAPALMIKTIAPRIEFPLSSISDKELQEANENFAAQGLPYAVVRKVDEAAA